jgi:hypothetical protein
MEMGRGRGMRGVVAMLIDMEMKVEVERNCVMFCWWIWIDMCDFGMISTLRRNIRILHDAPYIILVIPCVSLPRVFISVLLHEGSYYATSTHFTVISILDLSFLKAGQSSITGRFHSWEYIQKAM